LTTERDPQGSTHALQELPPLVRSLLAPAAYPAEERPIRVELLETHVSWLFFAESLVYKVKKPVDFGFLDFTTLERRHLFCEEELRLNRRLSPDVYLAVVPIAEREGRYAVQGPGSVVEYAVKMRRLPGDRWLSGLLERGDASLPLMRRLARRLAAFHADARVSGDVGGAATVRFNTTENFTQVRDQIGLTVSRPAFDRVRAYTEAFLDVRASHFAQRERDGRIRECHGDLHADQICVANGIAFIDCIEFNERFRWSDVAADIAFPAMDVDYHGRPDLATELVREWVTATGDRDVWTVLDFYKCYRAFTRGKVRGFRLLQPGHPAPQREAIREQAARYFDLAAGYARLRGPMLVVIGGLMGAGKSTLAASLGSRLGAVVLASDVLRKELAGISPDERRPDPWGEGLYRDEVSARTYDELHRRATERLRAGDLVILDASYRRATWRTDAREAARGAGAPFLFLEATCPDDIVRHRLTGRRSGPSDGRLELVSRQRQEFEPPFEIPAGERVRIDTSRAVDDVGMDASAVVYRSGLAQATPA